MIELGELFSVKYGVNLELNALVKSPDGINFVSRTAKNNGVSARVKPVAKIEPISAGTITVAGGGSVMESFLQPEPYYSGRDLYYLTATPPLTEAQKLYYCACLRANKYRFNYGRQANRTLQKIRVPAPDEMPEWVNRANPDLFLGADQPLRPAEPSPALEPEKWKAFTLSDLFDLRKGKRLTKADMIPGKIPFIGAIDSNNGLREWIGQAAIHEGNTLTVNYNGSVAEAFYQPTPYSATDDVNVLYPKFVLTPAIGMFLVTVIRQEKYRFNYGRKWHLERMKSSSIKLPAKSDGTPEWDFMENYIKTLPFSSQL
ncbi:MAG: restriction endonuclease subunit S [Chloroflexi bacterium]|nr:restriction endonuclease subunit S [Chloroflexota bacterium]